MSLSTGSTECFHFVVQGVPVAGEHMRAGDHDVDLARPSGDAGVDLIDPLRQRTESGGKASRNSGDGDSRSGEGLYCGWNEGMVYAHRANLNRELRDPEGSLEIAAQRAASFGAKPAHVAWCDVTR